MADEKTAALAISTIGGLDSGPYGQLQSQHALAKEHTWNMEYQHRNSRRAPVARTRLDKDFQAIIAMS